MTHSRQHDPLYPAAMGGVNSCAPAFRQRVQAAKVALRVGIDIETVRREHGGVILGNYIHVYIRLLYINLSSSLALYLTTSV